VIRHGPTMSHVQPKLNLLHVPFPFDTFCFTNHTLPSLYLLWFVPAPSKSSLQSLTCIQADKLRAQQQLEQLQSRYVGTGHADTTKFEWTSNIARDSYASYVGHAPLLEYMAIGMGECKEKVRAMMIEVSSKPVYENVEMSRG
jgi:splicing factor 3B subunit 5